MTMLTKMRLDLRAGECVRIGEDVYITLEEKSGKVARVTINAPQSKEIRRASNDNDKTVANSAEMQA